MTTTKGFWPFPCAQWLEWQPHLAEGGLGAHAALQGQLGAQAGVVGPQQREAERADGAISTLRGWGRCMACSSGPWMPAMRSTAMQT